MSTTERRLLAVLMIAAFLWCVTGSAAGASVGLLLSGTVPQKPFLIVNGAPVCQAGFKCTIENGVVTKVEVVE